MDREEEYQFKRYCEERGLHVESPDQTLKRDAGKIRPTLVPTEITRAIAKVRGFGVEKYGDSESWKKVDPQRYKDAAYRHFLAYIEDEDSKDDESGLPHLYHLACNIAFLIQLRSENENNI